MRKTASDGGSLYRFSLLTKPILPQPNKQHAAVTTTKTFESDNAKSSGIALRYVISWGTRLGTISAFEPLQFAEAPLIHQPFKTDVYPTLHAVTNKPGNFTMQLRTRSKTKNAYLADKLETQDGTGSLR